MVVELDLNRSLLVSDLKNERKNSNVSKSNDFKDKSRVSCIAGPIKRINFVIVSKWLSSKRKLN